MEPYHEGYEDGVSGSDYSNPHPMGSRSYESYDDGFADGRDEKESEENQYNDD